MTWSVWNILGWVVGTLAPGRWMALAPWRGLCRLKATSEKVRQGFPPLSTAAPSQQQHQDLRQHIPYRAPGPPPEKVVGVGARLGRSTF